MKKNLNCSKEHDIITIKHYKYIDRYQLERIFSKKLIPILGPNIDQNLKEKSLGYEFAQMKMISQSF